MAKSAQPKTSARATSEPEGLNALSLLEADHRAVDELFKTYETLEANSEKKSVADQICLALKVHAQIEEELFYPPARTKVGDPELIDEALVEHMGAKTLIAQIEATSPGQPLYDARIKVLGEQIRHHVQEEETELFPKVRDTKIDLAALGAKLAARKAELLDLMTAPRSA